MTRSSLTDQTLCPRLRASCSVIFGRGKDTQSKNRSLAHAEHKKKPVQTTLKANPCNLGFRDLGGAPPVANRLRVVQNVTRVRTLLPAFCQYISKKYRSETPQSKLKRKKTPVEVTHRTHFRTRRTLLTDCGFGEFGEPCSPQ